MRCARAGLAFILIAILSMLCGPALARQEVAPVKKPRQVPVCDGGGELEIKLHPSLITTIEVPLPTPRTYAADSERFTYWVDKNLVRMRPYHTAKPGDVTSAEIEVGEQWVSFKLRVVDDPDLVALRWQLVVNPALCARVLPPPPSSQAPLPSSVQALPLPKVASEIAVPRAGTDNMAIWHQELIPTRVTPLAGVLRADMLGGRWRGDDLEVDMQVENDTAQPSHVKAVRVWLGGIVKDREIRAQWLYPALARETNGAIMPPGSRAMMKLTVPGAARTGSSVLPLTMMLVGDDDKDAGGMRLEDWGMYPIYAEQIEQRRRDAEANGRISLFALLAAGVLWLANPFDEKDLDAATMWSLGGRARYEFNRYLGFEGDIALAWSKEARFNDVMQGELTRTATAGRASVGFVLQFGYETIPTFRGGVGLQGVHHEAAFVDTTLPGPELDFEIDAVWYFGAGVDRRITEKFKVGAEVSYFGQATESVGEGTSAVLQAGIHVVYSWKP